MQVWDLAAGACVQTIDNAHENVIMGLVNWQARSVPLLPQSACKKLPRQQAAAVSHTRRATCRAADERIGQPKWTSVQ